MAEWKDLSMGERNEIIELAVQNGISDLEQIKRMYNNASKGIDAKGVYETTPTVRRNWIPTPEDILKKGNLQLRGKENLEVLRESRNTNVPMDMTYTRLKEPKKEYSGKEYREMMEVRVRKEADDMWERTMEAAKQGGKDWYNPYIMGNEYGDLAYMPSVSIHRNKDIGNYRDDDLIKVQNARYKSLADRGFKEGNESKEEEWFGHNGVMFRPKPQQTVRKGYRVYRGEGELQTDSSLIEPKPVKKEYEEKFINEDGSLYSPNAVEQGDRYDNGWNPYDIGHSKEDGGMVRDNTNIYISPQDLALKAASRFNADHYREQQRRNHSDETVIKTAPYATLFQDSTGFIMPIVENLPVPYEDSMENIYPEMMLMGLNPMKKVPVERTTGIRNRVFKDTGLGLGKSNPNRFQTMPGNAYRITGREQIDDMVASGYVRPRAGKMRGGRSNEVHWAEGQDKLVYTDTDRFILQSKPSIDNTTKALRTKDLDAVWQFNGTNWENILNKGKLNIKNR